MLGISATHRTSLCRYHTHVETQRVPRLFRARLRRGTNLSIPPGESIATVLRHRTIDDLATASLDPLLPHACSRPERDSYGTSPAWRNTWSTRGGEKKCGVSVTPPPTVARTVRIQCSRRSPPPPPLHVAPARSGLRALLHGIVAPLLVYLLWGASPPRLLRAVHFWGSVPGFGRPRGSPGDVDEPQLGTHGW